MTPRVPDHLLKRPRPGTMPTIRERLIRACKEADMPLPATYLIADLGRPRGSVYRALNDLVADGTLETTRDGYVICRIRTETAEVKSALDDLQRAWG